MSSKTALSVSNSMKIKYLDAKYNNILETEEDCPI